MARRTVVPPVFVPPMGAISNRKFLERLAQWDTSVVRQKGENVVIRLHNGATAEVRAPNHHGANSPLAIQRVLDLLGVSWHEFMTRDLSPPTQEELNEFRTEMVGEVTDLLDAFAKSERTEEERRAAREERTRRKKERRDQAAREAARMTTPTAPPITEVGTQPTKRKYTKSGKPRKTGVIRRVYELVLQAGGEAVTAQTLQVKMPEIEISSIRGALLNLSRKDEIVRVSQGVYRSKSAVPQIIIHQDAPQVTRHPAEWDGEDRRNGDREDPHRTVEGPQSPFTAPVRTEDAPVGVQDQAVPERAPEGPEQPPMMVVNIPARERTATEQADEMVVEVLDLLMPQGFKAKHLPYIERFRRAACELIEAVENK